ncbi:hypothetical protein OJAV_G00054300 [Oryzias javanicus]|uniref:Uncharacterized protein n=1 Tax=Oryzias javanicus TaxID=123683 RepID=A0A3S2MQ38_ORYJA|nr:hypothetical protein OJAV_G00054300 [Oryzias javanicus]
MLELNFVCPCYGLERNQSLIFCFIFVPAVIFFILMYIYYVLNLGCSINRKNCCCCKCNWCGWNLCMHCFVPPIVWIILMLLDGRYIACAFTDWSGHYEVADGGGLMRWCKSDHNTDETLRRTEELYTTSQWYGFGGCFVLGLILCTGYCCCYEPRGQNPNHQDPEQQDGERVGEEMRQISPP